MVEMVLAGKIARVVAGREKRRSAAREEMEQRDDGEMIAGGRQPMPRRFAVLFCRRSARCRAAAIRKWQRGGCCLAGVRYARRDAAHAPRFTVLPR